MLGSFGDIVFEASSEKVLTFLSFARSAGVNVAEHAVIDSKPVPQITGYALDEIGFSITLNSAMGIDPVEEVKKMREMMNSGQEQALLLGSEVFGNWTLLSVDDEWKHVDAGGKPAIISVSLKLKEYP